MHRIPILTAFATTALAFTVGSTAARQAPNPAVKPEQRTDAGSKKLHDSFLEIAKKGDVDVLFVGDSITRGWASTGKKLWAERFAKWKPANFGIGGDRTQHILWRITEGKELDGIDPKVIVLMIGTNNFGSNTPEQVAEGVQVIVGEFRKQKPSAKILLLGVFPRSAKPGKELKDLERVTADGLHPKVAETNKRLAKLSDGKQLTFVDIGEKFLDDSGGISKKVMPDFLHLSDKGYEIWADAIETRVGEMLKR